MTTYARIVEGEAVDVVTSDPSELFHPQVAAEFQVVPDSVVAGSIQAANGTWTPPPETPATPAPAPSLYVNRYAFMQLFTAEERAAFYALQVQAEALPATAFGSAATPEQQPLAEFFDFLEQFNRLPDPPGIALNDPETNAAVGGLFVALGIITADRAVQVLANQSPPTTTPAASA